tara:strand:+ start:7718 stop:8086 length:369 start_codon:yes stop_codon:yes gene_type:complete
LPNYIKIRNNCQEKGDSMKKKQIKRIFKVVFISASIASLFFVPWILLKAWIMPLPDTVQEQVNAAIGYGFDGMIVYVDEAGIPPVCYAAGWKNRENKIQQIHNQFSKLPVLASYISLLPSPN